MRQFAFWLWMVFLALPAAVQAQAWVNTAYLEDPTQSLTIEEVASTTQAFEPTEHGFSAGYTRSVHWLRFELRPRGTDPNAPSVLEIRPPFLDDVRLYLPQADGSYEEKRTGDWMPYASRELPYFGLALTIPPLPSEGQTFYLRMQTSSSSILALRHWASEDFGPAKSHQSAALGVYYGVLLTLLTLLAWQGQWRYNALHRSFMVFTAAIAMGAFGLNDLIAPVWDDWHPRITDHWTSVSTLLIYASFGPLYIHLFELKPGQVLFRFYRWVMWLPLVGLLSIPLGIYTDIMPTLGLLTVVAVLIAVGLSWRPSQWRQTGGALIALAQLCVAYSGTNILLSAIGILPGHFWFVYGFQLAILLAIVLLMLMLVTRARHNAQQARQDRERAIAAESMVQAEKQSRQELSRFVAIFSHEIKTPLAVIQSSSQSLQLISPKSELETHKRLDRIVTASKRINELSEQFLLKDEIESLGFNPERKPLDLVQSVLTFIQDNDEHHRIDLSLPQKPLIVWGDELLMSMLINNLVSNALKYSAQDQRVQVTLISAPHGCTLSIQDHGPGIAPELIPHIFNSYFRGQRDGNIRGSGLGLYLVKRIAELLDVRVTVESNIGQGSVFSLHFPINTP